MKLFQFSCFIRRVKMNWPTLRRRIKRIKYLTDRALHLLFFSLKKNLFKFRSIDFFWIFKSFLYVFAIVNFCASLINLFNLIVLFKSKVNKKKSVCIIYKKCVLTFGLVGLEAICFQIISLVGWIVRRRSLNDLRLLLFLLLLYSGNEISAIKKNYELQQWWFNY